MVNIRLAVTLVYLKDVPQYLSAVSVATAVVVEDG